jgi:hypothetical protein
LPLGQQHVQGPHPYALREEVFSDVFLQDDTSVDYAVLTVESCRCRQDIVIARRWARRAMPVTLHQTGLHRLCCPA